MRFHKQTEHWKHPLQTQQKWSLICWRRFFFLSGICDICAHTHTHTGDLHIECRNSYWASHVQNVKPITRPCQADDVEVAFAPGSAHLVVDPWQRHGWFPRAVSGLPTKPGSFGGCLGYYGSDSPGSSLTHNSQKIVHQHSSTTMIPSRSHAATVAPLRFQLVSQLVKPGLLDTQKRVNSSQLRQKEASCSTKGFACRKWFRLVSRDHDRTTPPMKFHDCSLNSKKSITSAWKYPMILSASMCIWFSLLVQLCIVSSPHPGCSR